MDTTRRADRIMKLALALYEAAEDGARATALRVRKARRPRPRPPAGFTLRPGPDTPLWNALLAAAAPHLRARGSKARLARFLHLPRQRLHDCLRARTATLDAERTLLLLGWVAAQQQGRDLNT